MSSIPSTPSPARARIGTSSLRRKAQLLAHRPDLTVLDLRGNVDTRLKKLDDGEYDAIILAEAGLRRLGLSQRITQLLPTDTMIPAVGQGALAIETRADDEALKSALSFLCSDDTTAATIAERSFFSRPSTAAARSRSASTAGSTTDS